MKKILNFGTIGAILLLAAGFLPLAYINSQSVTLFPFFDNMEIGQSIWVWRDLSAFAVTYALTSILILYFIYKDKLLAIIILVSLNLVCSFVFLAGVWMAQLKTMDFPGTGFSYSWGWLFVVTGLILVFVYAYRLKKSKDSDKQG